MFQHNNCYRPNYNQTAATTISPKSYTTVTVTHCDDNGCNTKTVTPRLPNKHHWPLAQSPSLCSTSILLLPAPSLVLSFNPKVWRWFENQCFKAIWQVFSHPCFLK
ncbi:AMP_1a_G0000090.mRNA.1.CDS.1 [Saccharomyces cerevisiae]|nr:AMP_1a_G0000090.mRNA.1.CDS.1 [Saccharomyces cerevisiae]CAI6466160.1 AMP_1a_G0000090.mRNA.1.CDS.1 [Saccharomyces cerevisiae]